MSDNIDYLKALSLLFPGTQFTCGDNYEDIILLEGQQMPTKEECIAAANQAEVIEAIKEELVGLDRFVGRDAEAFYLANPDADAFLYQKVLRKIELRGQL